MGFDPPTDEYEEEEEEVFSTPDTWEGRSDTSV